MPRRGGMVPETPEPVKSLGMIRELRVNFASSATQKRERELLPYADVSDESW